MAHDPGTTIIINDGYWMHIRHIQVHHRRYPEVRGEGASLAAAAAHLAAQLARTLDCAPGPRRRDAVATALADVRALGRGRRPGPDAAKR